MSTRKQLTKRVTVDNADAYQRGPQKNSPNVSEFFRTANERRLRRASSYGGTGRRRLKVLR